MKKIIAMRRSRNHTLVYLVMQDRPTRTVAVWRCDPDHTAQLQHCYTFEYPSQDDGGETAAQRRAVSLADALSRMSLTEALKQADNITRFGEVR